MDPSEVLARRVEEIPGVVSGPSRIGNSRHQAWFAHGREFAHLHAGDVIDIRLPTNTQRELRSDPRAMFRKNRSAWVEFRFLSAADIEDAIRLLRIAYDATRA